MALIDDIVSQKIFLKLWKKYYAVSRLIFIIFLLKWLWYFRMRRQKKKGLFKLSYQQQSRGERPTEDLQGALGAGGAPRSAKTGKDKSRSADGEHPSPNTQAAKVLEKVPKAIHYLK
jgi:hypothetical protein